MNHRTRGAGYVLKKVGIILLAAVIIYIALSLCLSPLIYRTIFASIRESDLNFDYPYEAIADTVPRETVSFLSGENTLRGYIYHAAAPKATVIVANGIGSDADAHLPETLYFLEHGYNILTYDGTGVGRSDGESIVGLPQMRLDLLAAIDYLAGISGLPIVLYGHSAGGYAAAAVSDNKAVRAAVTVAAFNSPVETMRHMSHRYAGLLSETGMPFLLLAHRGTFGEDGFIEAIDVINATNTPVAVFYGDHDKTVDPAISLYEKRGDVTNPNAVFIQMNGGHSDLWLTQRAADYRDIVRADFDALSVQYGRDIPDEIMTDFSEGIDRKCANELNAGFMEEVIAFFEAALAA